MTGSQVDLLAAGMPAVMEGRIISLEGERFDAHVASINGNSLNLHAVLNMDQGPRRRERNTPTTRRGRLMSYDAGPSGLPRLLAGLQPTGG